MLTNVFKLQRNKILSTKDGMEISTSSSQTTEALPILKPSSIKGSIEESHSSISKVLVR